MRSGGAVEQLLGEGMAFFEISKPRDMLDKAKREHARLIQSLDIDNIFNFFVTVYHIKDYVEKSGSVLQADLDLFLSDKSIKACRDLCDKGKHMRLTQKGRNDPSTVAYSGTLSGAPLGSLVLSGGDKWLVFCGSDEFDIELLANDAIKKWDSFFQRHGL